MEYGAGKPVIFIPGWTYTVKVFARNLPVFAEHYRALAYDPRSHGDSSVTAGGNNFKQHGIDLHEFITRLDIDDCLIAGWSFGACTAYSYFEQYGSARVRGFIGIDEPPKIRKETASDWGEGKKDELQAGMEMLTNHGHLNFFEDYLHHCYVNQPDPAFVRDMLSEAAKTPEPIACDLIKTSFDLDYREVARRIDKEIPVMQVVREDWRQAAGKWISEKLYTLSHEPAVGFAADAAARFHSKPSVAAVTYGAGAFNMVNPVAAAYAEKSPVIVISGGPGRADKSTGLLVHHQAKQLHSQVQVYKEVTCDQVILEDTAQAPEQIARVLKNCIIESRPVYIEVPRDQVFEPCDPVPVLPLISPCDADALNACTMRSSNPWDRPTRRC